MKKLLIISLIFFWNCNEEQKKNSKSVKKITISKVEGSPSFDEAKLSLSDSITKREDSYSFSFNVDEYKLGDQTSKKFNYNLANSDKGQHIHLIINNGPYFAKYSNNFDQKLEEENSVILAFLSRSYHESVKNPNAYFLTKIGKNNKIDLDNQLLFYSRPKGTYEGEATKKLLLDFYLINTKISSEGNKVRATIEDTEFLIDEWAPYYIEGLPMGEVSIKLELIDSNGDLIKTPFNPSIRKVVLK